MPFSLDAAAHYHLVGIGGAGMSAIARLLLQRGFTVSGSDQAANAQTAALAALGARVALGHDAANIAGAGALIVTSAVHGDHPEIAAAQAQGIPVFKRSEMIAGLMTGKRVIAVAGTHGKTTTTAMIAHILRETGRHPSYLIGGVLRPPLGVGAGQAGDNAAWDDAGESFVIEADEYDHMFLGLRPDVAVLTNIEWDHPDFFTTEAALIESFQRFVALLPPQGRLIACADSPLARQVAGPLGDAVGGPSGDVVGGPLDDAVGGPAGERVLFYGSSAHDPSQTAPSPTAPSQTALSQIVPLAGWAASIRVTPEGTIFSAHLAAHGAASAPVEVRLQLAGAHNALNALAAMLAVASAESISPAESARALATFAGTGRRFEVRCDEEMRGAGGAIAVIDDYAHHPTAIRATILAARGRYPDRALWVVWQPHTFSRTAALWDDYLTVLAEAAAAGAHVLVTDIYAARETPAGQQVHGHPVTAARLVAEVDLPAVQHTATLEETSARLLHEVAAPAAILILSAGDAPAVGIAFVRARGL